MLKNDGIPSFEELQTVMPAPERLAKGPVAIIECFQDIPCDPCVISCPKHAILMKSGITDKPKLEPQLCIGCTICVNSCPGLAIFVVDMTHSEKSAALTLPYEMLPVPKVGDIVAGLDRNGKQVCEVKVLRASSNKKYDKTWAITIELPKTHVNDIRGIRVAAGKRSSK
ncbi:MAG: 4Fe-4S binding protein [Candidatus Riflebacteria bacterium]|nr:4Fe-4S binding protein [Candidatus Riflebacteria bacterium]